MSEEFFLKFFPRVILNLTWMNPRCYFIDVIDIIDLTYEIKIIFFLYKYELPESVLAISHPCGKSGSKSFRTSDGGFLGGRGVP